MSRIVSIVANCQSIIIPSQNTPKLQLLGVLEGSQTWSGEVDGRLQAGDLLVIVGVDIGKDVVGSRRNGSGQVDALRDGHLTLFKGASEIDVAQLLAQVRSRREQLDEAVLDGHLDVRALCDGLLDVAGRCDEKRRTGLRGIGSQIDFLNLNKIIRAVAVAEFDGVLSRDLEAGVER